MINLLPYELKKQTKAARLNVVLFRYFVILGASIGFVFLACAGAYTFLNLTNMNNQQQLDKLKTAPVSASSTQGQANRLQTSLVTAKNILDQQVIYSDIITSLGSTLPNGTIVDSLTLSDNLFGTTVEMKIRAASADLEPQVRANFTSSTIFSGYKMASTAQEAGSPNYSYVFNVSLTINKVIAR